MKNFLLSFIGATLIGITPAMAVQPFGQWIEGVKTEARSKGISERTIMEALSGVQPIPRVIELDRKQPEGKMSFAQYYERVINKQRIDTGRYLYQKHWHELNKAASRYGVPAQYIVALWGIETSYGDNTGGFDVIAALATLAHEGRRAEFFRSELINALKIIDQGHITAADMKGSWAGAMGQNQFMPSSFHNFAVDGNGDNRRDIWTSLPDVFASTANYLSKSGWKEDERWGREVKVPSYFNTDLAGLDTRKSLSEWSRLGVTLPNGVDLPAFDGMQGSIVQPDGVSGPSYLVYDNYRVIMRWNKSTYFATSVGLLADQIAR